MLYSIIKSFFPAGQVYTAFMNQLSIMYFAPIIQIALECYEEKKKKNDILNKLVVRIQQIARQSKYAYPYQGTGSISVSLHASLHLEVFWLKPILQYELYCWKWFSFMFECLTLTTVCLSFRYSSCDSNNSCASFKCQAKPFMIELKSCPRTINMPISG